MIQRILDPLKLLFGLKAAKKEELNVNDIYTPLSVAKEEIWRRWNDEKLRKKVDKFLKGKIPDIFSDGPKAILFRNIATPNYESDRFIDLANMISLNPAYLEFSSDKFCTRNKDKICLGKMCFSDKHKPAHHTYRKIIDLKVSDNKSFGEIKTLWGDNLADFHHRIFRKKHGDEKLNFFDVSYLKDETKDINGIYDNFLAYFICFGVLFENFILKDGHYESNFTKNVMYPAFKKNMERFGVTPLIVPLLPINDEDGESWMWYPGELEKEIKNQI